MGAGNSKPDASTGLKHVFASETPVQFSANLVEALQSSAETDSSRAKSLELHIQARVREELDRIRQREQKTLEEIEKHIAAEFNGASTTSILPKASASVTPPSTSPSKTVGSLDLDAPRIPFAGREFDAPSVPAAPSPQQQQTSPSSAAYPPPHEFDRDASRDSVLKEIDRLRNKLESRKKLAVLDDTVERAKSEVVNCLRINNRRPLDCWKEVEGFKAEVAKLERSFVDKVVG